MMHQVLLTVAALVMTAGTARAAPTEQERPAPAWTPDKAALGQLAPEVNTPGFRIRPPKGYALQQQARGTGQGFSWVGPVRKDGTRPYLMVLVLTPPPGETKEYTPEQAMDTLLVGIEKRRDDWQRSAAEHGRVNGQEFVRARWSGIESAGRQKMHGFSYVTVNNGTIVQISSQDVEPHHSAALKLTETAALTFRMP